MFWIFLGCHASSVPPLHSAEDTAIIVAGNWAVETKDPCHRTEAPQWLASAAVDTDWTAPTTPGTYEPGGVGLILVDAAPWLVWSRPFSGNAWEAITFRGGTPVMGTMPFNVRGMSQGDLDHNGQTDLVVVGTMELEQ